MVYINNNETLFQEFSGKFTLTELICTASLSSLVREGLLHCFTTHSARNDQSTFSCLQKNSGTDLLLKHKETKTIAIGI